MNMSSFVKATDRPLLKGIIQGFILFVLFLVTCSLVVLTQLSIDFEERFAPIKLLAHLSDNYRKQNGVIYYLTMSSRIDSLKSSLISLDLNFNDKYKYPVIIFYEDADKLFNETQILQATNSTVHFHRIIFEIPPFINRSAIPQYGCLKSFTIGYRHMCRFHAIGVYELPTLREYEYALRLDDDSQLLRPIGYDIFEYMRNNRLQYGYVMESTDSPQCVVGLWEAANSYARNQSIVPPTFYREWPKYRIFYNNFEISALSLWNSVSYRQFSSYIDRLGGIYFRRWGDAPIKTLAVTLLVHKNETHRFADIGYRHKF